ncbi:hypothetical protein [Bacillus mesophilum]|uniref:hypothetical protein n=1 Tax=Bacillus mesophilum TaxID=1071718 RepID=UPI001864B9D8|nr:hypothetical protein [Bacillus mesophilum]
MPYIVIKDFKDLQDDNHIYSKGDKYPRKGRGKKDRVEELASIKNKQGVPLIKEVENDE